MKPDSIEPTWLSVERAERKHLDRQHLQDRSGAAGRRASAARSNPPETVAQANLWVFRDRRTRGSGTPNTPVTIPPAGSQSFVLAIMPATAFAPTEIPFTFAGTNTVQAATIIWVNTLLMSGSVTPLPDIVALVASRTRVG